MTAANQDCCGDPRPHEEASTQTLKEDIQKLTFQRLLETHEGVPIATLAKGLGESLEQVEAALADLDRQGLIRRNQRGEVVGSVGLSVEPSRHQLFIGPTRFWTWCAYDAIGILAALGATGEVHSKSPLTGAPIDLRFRDGSPEKSDVVLFLPKSIASLSDSTPSPAPGDSVFDNWCPLANLFENRAESLAWAESHRAHGQTLSLTEAAARGASHWQPVVPVRKD